MQTPSFSDPRIDIATGSLTTTNNTITTIATIPIPTGDSVILSIELLGKWISGTSGDANYQLAQKYSTCLRNVAGTIYTGSSAYALNWNPNALGGLSISTPVAAQSLEIKTSGLNNMNISWKINIGITRL